MTGFGHGAVLSVAEQVIDAVKAGAIKHFFLVGGCDGAVFESIVPEAKNMTDEEATALLRLALTSEPAREFLRKRAEETTS